jgi:hypothetical protein
MSDTLQRLCKWRQIFAGWQLGTRPIEDPEVQAVRDQREILLLLRAEVSALTVILLRRRTMTQAEFEAALDVEAEHLMRALEKRFPGARAELDGMHINTAEADPWLSKFPP